MKQLKEYILPIIIVVLIVVLVISTRNKKMSDEQAIPQEITVDTAAELFGNEDSYIKNLCYLYEAPVEIQGQEEVVYNREFIEMNIVDGDAVSGTHVILPAEHDSNRATFVGATNGEFVNVIATASAEGETWQEQRVYKRDNGRIYVGYQDVYEPQEQNEFGVYMYTQPITELKFETEEFYLGLVDCESIDRSVL